MVSRRKEVECFKCGRPQMRLTNLEFGSIPICQRRNVRTTQTRGFTFIGKRKNNMAKKRKKKKRS